MISIFFSALSVTAHLPTPEQFCERPQLSAEVSQIFTKPFVDSIVNGCNELFMATILKYSTKLEYQSAEMSARQARDSAVLAEIIKRTGGINSPIVVRLSQSNEMDAKVALANIYYHSLGVSYDAALARSLYQGAYDQSEIAKFQYAWMCRWGDGGDKDPVTAINIFRALADDGMVAAQIAYANSIKNNIDDGNGKRIITADRERSEEYFKKAIDRGSGEAANYLGVLYSQNKEQISLANAYFEQASKMGAPYGSRNLAFSYFNGDGVNASAAEGLRLLNLAIKQGSADAISELAEIYRDGKFGITKNEVLSRGLYQEAAGKGAASAIYEIGRWHEEGIGVPRSIELATNYYEKASKLGDEGAKKALRRVKSMIKIGSLYVPGNICVTAIKRPTRNLLSSTINRGSKLLSQRDIKISGKLVGFEQIIEMTYLTLQDSSYFVEHSDKFRCVVNSKGVASVYALD